MIESHIYNSRGVSSSKSDVHDIVKSLDPGIYPSAFCKIMPNIFNDDPNEFTSMHSDGVGSKSSLAYIYWKETGDISVFRDLAIDAIVMNIDDLICIGAVNNPFMISNIINRNKFQIPGNVLSEIINGFNEFADKLNNYNIDLVMAGGETADLGDIIKTISIDTTVITNIHKDDIIDLNNIKPGSAIIGLSSSGQANWETKYNSGIGSNGLTAARHSCLNRYYADHYPESYSYDIHYELAYSGNGKLEDNLDGCPITLGEALLSPTRTYAPLIQECLNLHKKHIHGIIHCTGGGQTKCLKFGKNIHYIKDNLFDIPPIFKYIQKSEKCKLDDMYPIYNMGHLLEIIVDPSIVDFILDISSNFNINAKQIGYCESSENNSLTIINRENDTKINYN